MKKLEFFTKKVLCWVCLLCLVALLFAFAGCKPSKMQQAVESGNHYTIVASYDNEHHIVSATQTVTFTNRSENAFECVKFHIYANAYREDAVGAIVPAKYHALAYPNGESYGQIDFDTVKVDGMPVAYVIEGQDMDILSVPTKEIFPDESVEIEMTYQIQLANIHHRLGYTANAVHLGNWFPILCRVSNNAFDCTPYYNVGDPFVSDVANFDVKITLPSNFVVASTGTMTEASNGEAGITYCYEAQAVRDFALMMSPHYQKLSQMVGDTTINYYYFADKNPQQSLLTAVESFEYFCKNVGDYPYDTYSVCETDFCYGGMEYPNIVMVASKSQAYDQAIAHETAHQWFYGVVGNDQIANAWMDEGLAEFLTYLYLEESGKMPLAKNILANTKTYTTYVDVLNHFYTDVERNFRPICDYKSDGEYVIMTYVKGSLLFNTLYESLGAPKFWKCIAHYYQTAQFQIAEPNTMSGCFASIGGKQVENIFTTFAEGKEIIGEMKD